MATKATRRKKPLKTRTAYRKGVEAQKALGEKESTDFGKSSPSLKRLKKAVRKKAPDPDFAEVDEPTPQIKRFMEMAAKDAETIAALKEEKRGNLFALKRALDEIRMLRRQVSDDAIALNVFEMAAAIATGGKIGVPIDGPGNQYGEAMRPNVEWEITGILDQEREFLGLLGSNI